MHSFATIELHAIASLSDTCALGEYSVKIFELDPPTYYDTWLTIIREEVEERSMDHED